MASIVPVTTRRQRGQFIDLPYSMYRGDPRFVPPLRRDERRRFEPQHNPFLEHASIATWLALDDGQVVGRVAAINDRLHDDLHREPTTWFGFFEARDEGIARELLAAVEAHAQTRGSRVVRGPVNPSLHDACGLLVDGFDDPPYALMPYNPPAYAAFIEACGFRKVKDLHAWDMDLLQPVAPRVARVADRVRRRNGVRVRRVDLQRFDAELEILQSIYRDAWADNWGFVPPTDAEIRQLAVELKPVVDPELVLFAEMRGRPVACAVAIPDVNQVLARMNGRLLPFGLVHFVRRRQIITRARMLLLGVLPEARGLGVYPLLIVEAQRRAIRAGYSRAEVGWTLEDNELVNAGIEAAGGCRYKTYRLYEKPLG